MFAKHFIFNKMAFKNQLAHECRGLVHDSQLVRVTLAASARLWRVQVQNFS